MSSKNLLDSFRKTAVHDPRKTKSIFFGFFAIHSPTLGVGMMLWPIGIIIISASQWPERLDNIHVVGTHAPWFVEKLAVGGLEADGTAIKKDLLQFSFFQKFNNHFPTPIVTAFGL